jgi:hypothetical protein
MAESNHMTPSFEIHHTGNNGNTNSEFRSKIFQGFLPKRIKASDFSHLFIIKFCQMAFNAARQSFWHSSRRVVVPELSNLWMGVNPTSNSRSLTTLFNFVFLVVVVSPNKKVHGIYTRLRVTFMANELSFWNFSIFKLVGNPVRASIRAISSAVTKLAIAVWKFTSSPNPAGAKFWTVLRNGAVFINLTPKPLNVFFSHKQKNRHPMKVLSAHLWPQSLSDGKNILSSNAFFSHNRATFNIT